MFRSSAAAVTSHVRKDEPSQTETQARRGSALAQVTTTFVAAALTIVASRQGQGADGAKAGRRPEAACRDGEAERSLLADLERVRSATPDHFNPERFDREMSAAFRAHGLDLDLAEPKEAAARLAGRPSTPAIVAAIDDWCRARRVDLDVPTWRRLSEVARAADRDPWRNSLRDQYERSPADAIPALRARAAEVVAMEKQPLGSLLLLVRMLWDAGEPATATPVLYLAERRFPDEFWVCFEQGNLNTVGAPNPDPTEAVHYLGRAVALRPRSFAAHCSLANALLAQKKLDEAIAEYRLAIKLNPEDADSHHALGEALLERGNEVEATAAFREAMRLKPDVAALPNVAVAAPEIGKAIQAVAARHEAVRLDPRAIDHFDRGHAWLFKNEYDKAIAELDQAIHIQPGFAEPYVDRGFAHSSKREYHQALADYEKAIGLDPQNLAAFNFRAWLRATCPDAKIRDGNKALESAIWACALSEWKDAFALGTLAAAYAETSDFRAAVKSQNKAIGFLTDLKQKEDFCMRLKLYQEKTAYHQPTPREATAQR